MLVHGVDSSKSISNIIFERKGSISGNRVFVNRYLAEFPDAFLDYNDQIIVEKTDGIKVIYFRNDFVDEEKYVRLYNYILTGNSSRLYYLKSKAIYLKNKDEREFRNYFNTLSKEEKDAVYACDNRDFYFDFDEFSYRTLFIGEPYNEVIGEWIVESEFSKEVDIIEQNEEWLKLAIHANNDLYVIYYNKGRTLFDLVETARKVLDFVHGEYQSEESGGSTAILARKTDSDLEFLFRENRNMYYEKLRERIPFANELKEKLMEKRETFQECLYRLMDKYGIETVSKLTATNYRPGVSKAVMSKWINNKDPNRTPDKNTVYTIIMSAQLEMDDAIDLLNSAKLEFGSTDEDIIVKMFIDKKEYDLEKLDWTIFEITGKTLLNPKTSQRVE